MNESKLSTSGDRLGELPDSLIFHIFWFLPITDVVRTTKLSRRWKDLWKIAPFLNFSHYDVSSYRVEGAVDKVRNFYNRALLLWRGPKLLKFKVMFRHQLLTSLIVDINVWVRFAKEKGVKELFLDLQYPSEVDDSDTEAELQSLYLCSSLESVYSCSSLEVLSLKGCPFWKGVNVNVKWDRLKSLTFHAYCLRQDLLSKVLCGSPKLEVLILEYYVPRGNYSIQFNSLKKLSIIKKCSDTYVRNIEMKIQTPNLETLEIKGIPYSKFSMDASPVTDVTLGLYCLEGCCKCGAAGAFLDVKGTLEQILPIIQHVESLTLSECCLKVLGLMSKKSLLSPFSKVKFLKLNASSNHLGSFSKHLQIAGLLKSFPKLKRLVIEDEYEGVVLSEDENEDDYQDDRESLKFEANLPNSFLLQLRMVEVTWSACDESIFLFIKTLLKYASKLEKVVFRVNGSMPHSALLASKKLLRMPRSSPTAQLYFQHDSR